MASQLGSLPRLRLALAGGLVTLGLLWGSAASAALVSPVSVSLLAPGGTVSNNTPITATASVPTAVGLFSGDPGNDISGFWMLPGESITFSGNSILLRVAAGADTAGVLTTGFLGDGLGNHARYQFDGLSVLGETITGLSMTSTPGVAITGVSGMHAALVGGNQIDFWLDDLLFSGLQTGFGSGDVYADFRIDLITTRDGGNGDPGTVPEPGTWALLLVALVAHQVVARRKPAA